MTNAITSSSTAEEGQTMAEYSVVLGVLVLGVIAAITLLGGAVAGKLGAAVTIVSGAVG